MSKEWKRIGTKLIPYLLIIAFTLVLLWSGISNQSFVGGLDTNFHMNGFYEAARQIATGHYSYFMSQFGFNQSGRIVNALYGPAFNYLGGLLLLMIHSWARFQLTLLFVTIVIAGVGMYLVALKCRVNRIIATALAFLYMMSHPIITGWFGNSEFMGLGAALMPFLLISGIDVVQHRRVRILLLAVPMAVMLQIHLMTSLVTTLALAPFMLLGLCLSRHRIRFVRNGVIAVGMAFLLSGNIFGTIYDVYSSNYLIPTFPVFKMQSMGNSLRLHSDHVALPAIFFILAVILIYVACQSKHLRVLDWTLLFDGLAFLFMSTGYFPWDRLWHVWPSIACIVQFPTRFLPVALLTLLLLFGRILTRLTDLTSLEPLRGAISGVVGITLAVILILNYVPTRSYVNWASSVVWHRSYVVRYSGLSAHRRDGRWLRMVFQSHNLRWGLVAINKITTDYLPTPHKMMISDYYSAPTYHNFASDFIKNRVKYHKRVSRRQIDLTWRTPARNKLKRTPLVKVPKEQIVVPAVAYRHSVVKLNGRRIHPQRTLVGAVTLRSRAGQRNRLTISYQPGRIFKMLSALAIISWLILLIYAAFRLLKNLSKRVMTQRPA